MELFFQNIYFRPPQENVLNRLVKNNKGKFGKRRRKQQIIHTFWWIKCRNPNLHQIHNNIKDCRSKYAIFSFRYLFADNYPQDGAHNWSLSVSWLDVTSYQIFVSLRGGPRGADVAISRNAVRCAKKHQSIEQFGDIQWTLVQKLLVDRTRRFPRALCALGMTCLRVRLIER